MKKLSSDVQSQFTYSNYTFQDIMRTYQRNSLQKIKLRSKCTNNYLGLAYILKLPHMANFLFLYCWYCFMFSKLDIFHYFHCFFIFRTQICIRFFITFQLFSCGFDRLYIFSFFTEQKSEQRANRSIITVELQQIVVYKVQLSTLSKCSPSRRVLHTQQSLELLQLSLSQYYSSHTIHTKYDARRFP